MVKTQDNTPGVPAKTHDKKRILVIDDDPGILDAVEMLLGLKGYEVMSIDGLGNIDDMVDHYKPDLILLDMILRGNDGRAITRNLKAKKQKKNIPIIMVSAHPDARVFSREAGADDFVPKPFQTKKLLERIEHFTNT